MENLKERKTGFSKKLKFHIYIRAKYWACSKVAADIGSDMSTPHKISMSFQFHKWFLRPCNSPWCDCVLSVSSDYSGILADVAADLSQRLLWSQGPGSPSGQGLHANVGASQQNYSPGEKEMVFSLVYRRTFGHWAIWLYLSGNPFLTLTRTWYWGPGICPQTLMILISMRLETSENNLLAFMLSLVVLFIRFVLFLCVSLIFFHCSFIVLLLKHGHFYFHIFFTQLVMQYIFVPALNKHCGIIIIHEGSYVPPSH